MNKRPNKPKHYYRIAWRSRITGFESCGAFVFESKADAQEEVKRLNAKFPELEHWVEGKVMSEVQKR